MGLLDHNVVLISRQAEIFDEAGARIGTIRREPVPKRRLISFFSQVWPRLGVYGDPEVKVLELLRPRRGLSSPVEVGDGRGASAGSIERGSPDARLRRFRAGLRDAAGQTIGEIVREGPRAPFTAIVDGRGAEVGRITWARKGAADLFSVGVPYRVELSPSLRGPLRLLAFAAAVSLWSARQAQDLDTWVVPPQPL